MKPLKYIKYVLFDYNLFLKLPIQMKGYLVMRYNQLISSDSEEIKKYLMFKWTLFVIQKLVSSCMIGFYVHK